MPRVGYIISAGGESGKVILPQEYTSEEAQRQVEGANRAEARTSGTLLESEPAHSRLRASRPTSMTVWFVTEEQPTP